VSEDAWYELIAITGHADVEEIRRILQEHPDALKLEEIDGQPIYTRPIHEAVGENQSIAKLRLLLDHGAEPDAVSWRAMTPLLLAIRAERVDMVEMLLRHEADPNQPGPEGFTALDFAEQWNSPKCAEALRAAGGKRRDELTAELN
jgi:hypothetical protein